MNQSLADANLALARDRLALDRDIFVAGERRKDTELELKKGNKPEGGWRSPLVVAILAASVAAAGNALVAIVNGQLERDLEGRKAESARILQMITADTNQAFNNLTFLTKIGLIRDPKVKDGLKRYLAEDWTSDTGPSLSSTFRTLNSVAPGSTLCVNASSDVAQFNATLNAGAQVVASWHGFELKSMCEKLQLSVEVPYMLDVSLTFLKTGHAKIEAQIFDASGTGGKPVTFELDGSKGEVTSTTLVLRSRQ